MNPTPPQFAVLSTQQEKAKDRAKVLKREGHLMDQIKLVFKKYKFNTKIKPGYDYDF